ncbi:MAG TPA: molybdopterin-synthase adenylyltransferase MoeB [Myxococcales bacterium]|nr:molybdopterin-synthase adenylyltransferase MoeB [Myxococcales bacterium]
MAEAKTKAELLKVARTQVPEVTPAELAKELQSRRPALIDVREKQETDQGILPGAKLVPRGYLELRIEETLPDRDADVVLYCAGGTRSLLAGRTLHEMGYRKVRSLRGGYGAWKDGGLPVEMPFRLTDAQRNRYSRHLLIPEVGEAGQAKLLKAKVLLIGAGGLGSPAGLYLAAAGVGRLGIVDDDVVDESNLQRQVLHDTERVGMAKTESARATIRKLNPDVTVDEHRVRLDRDNALDLFRQYDLIIDGSDNFGTRYLVNDACVLLGKPNVHGSIFRFDGQATTFIPGGGRPCYRCLFPEPPPAELAPSCQEAGVLGVLPGVIGLIQAVEGVKVILGQGEPLVGRLLLYDALEQRFREVKYARDRECPACGDHPMRELLPEYTEASCAVAPRRASA